MFDHKPCLVFVMISFAVQYLLDLEMFAGSNEAFEDENEEDDDDNE